MQFLPQLLDFFSLFTSTSFVFLNDLILGAFRCPIFYLSLHLFVTFVQSYATSKFFFTRHSKDQKPDQQKEEKNESNNPLSLTISNRAIAAFLGSLSKIFIYLSVKYNSILFYQMTRLFSIPLVLIYQLFISPHFNKSNIASNENQSMKDHSQNLILFCIILFGVILFSIRDVQFSFSPGLIVAFFSALFASFYEIYIMTLKQNYFNNSRIMNSEIDNGDNHSDINQQNYFEILKGELSLYELIITLLFALIFETGLIHNSDNSIFNPTLFVLPNPHQVKIYGKHEKAHIISYIFIGILILVYQNFVDQTLATAYIPIAYGNDSLYFLIIDLIKPLLVLIIAFANLNDKKLENIFGIFFVLIGYAFYCIIEIQHLRREIRARQMKFQEEEDNLDEPLGNRGEEGIFPNAINTEEM